MNSFKTAICKSLMDASEHHMAMCQCHKAAACECDKIASDGSYAKAFHTAAADAHLKAAQSCIENCKAIAADDKDDDGKPVVNQETRTNDDGTKLVRAALGEIPGDRIVPDKVVGVFQTEPPKNVTAIPRFGSPEISTSGVPAEFIDLVKID